MDDLTEKTPHKHEPFLNLPGVVTGVVGVLVGLHLLLQIAGPDWQIWSQFAFAFIPARISGSAPYPAIPGSQMWSFVTYAFLHGGWMHVLLNSLWYAIFGAVVARRLGSPRFLLLSAISAVGGAIATLVVYWGVDAIMVGASAAVSGVIAGAIPIMYGKRSLQPDGSLADVTQVQALRPIELITDRRALFFLILWLAVTLFSGATGWTGNSFADDFRIAWEAHLGGFLAGLISFYLLDKGLPRVPA
jgi:membrane associated rhomboid family serine protease